MGQFANWPIWAIGQLGQLTNWQFRQLVNSPIGPIGPMANWSIDRLATCQSANRQPVNCNSICQFGKFVNWPNWLISQLAHYPN